jgi:hypothetical protein
LLCSWTYSSVLCISTSQISTQTASLSPFDKALGTTDVGRPGHKQAPKDPGLTASLLHCNFVILSYLKDGKGAMTWKKNQWLSANKGSYAVNVLLES